MNATQYGQPGPLHRAAMANVTTAVKYGVDFPIADLHAGRLELSHACQLPEEQRRQRQLDAVPLPHRFLETLKKKLR